MEETGAAKGGEIKEMDRQIGRKATCADGLLSADSRFVYLCFSSWDRVKLAQFF